MRVERFAMILGIIYLAAGVLGFIPGLLTSPGAHGLALEGFHGRLLGIFPINWVHNLVHLAVGAWGVASAKGFNSAVGFSRGLTVVYVILAVMGLFPVLNTMFGLAPLHGNDIWLHGGTAAVTAYFGWGAPARRHARVHA
jgi:hypothetical protein